MATTTTRRPLHALLALLALLLLTGIVWWRVAGRDDGGSSSASGCPSPTSSSSAAATLPAPAAITVQVLNSTNKSGLAGKVRTRLQQDGFGVSEPGNSKPAYAGSAQIRFGPSGAKAAKLVRYYFPGATMQASTSKTATVVVVLGAGYTSVATTGQVQAALRGDKLSVAPATNAPPVPGSC